MSRNLSGFGIDGPSSGKRRLKALLAQSDNRKCADCGAPDPKWASANMGVFLCLKCCGVHRSLGTHVSKVLSVTLDEWSDYEIDSMIEVGGNASANSTYEAHIPEGVSKPGPDSSHHVLTQFIRSKYEFQEFLKPGLRISSSNKKDPPPLEASFSRSSSSQISEGMVEFIGMLKVKVIRGTNLAIRDMLSSDPYVILTLGHQKAQTSVIPSNLNPIWNEELMLSVPQDYGSIKLQVYDHDTFSADDIMGEAEIDLQPMITAASLASGDVGMLCDMQIGKWLRSNDNALIRDSPVKIMDGKIKQELSLKLQNVECGARWKWNWSGSIPLDQ
ncbi:hypothetical protein M569_03763 [Genlisea aurea]|uniref:Uncharacterized protein n=1 Tax=Genlisea aurea TaxID=192259 RepID=S8EEL7_9LAMI|nr:hypothetical protein M569_03763 [Genlisea aurea]